MSVLFSKTLESPLGTLLVTMDEADRVNHLLFDSDFSRNKLDQKYTLIEEDNGFEHVEDQLARYFEGTLREFNVDTNPSGTDFQQRVWQELKKIPYGTVISYLELARRVGDTKAVRAVGHANNQNPIPILIPCHRVIGAKGDLIGFGGGLDRKKYLLEMEGSITGSLF